MATKEKQLFTRFVEIGRVVLLQYGPHVGKLATIVDIVDQTRVLVDSPVTAGAEAITGFGREIVPMKWVALTDFKVDAKRNAKAKQLAKAWADAGVAAGWAKSAWGKKVAAKVAKPKVTDFQRFEAQLKAQEVAKKVRKAVKA